MPERDTYFSSDVASVDQNLNVVASIYEPFRKYFNGLELVAKGNVDKVQRKIRYAQDDLGFQKHTQSVFDRLQNLGIIYR